jgi:nitrogenase molybdenum-iron protein alpha/beta subunit
MKALRLFKFKKQYKSSFEHKKTKLFKSLKNQIPSSHQPYKLLSPKNLFKYMWEQKKDLPKRGIQFRSLIPARPTRNTQ